MSLNKYDEQYWATKYAADRVKKEELIALGMTPQEACQIAYRHQYAYAKTQAGKDRQKAWLQTPKGKASRKRSDAVWAAKMKEARAQCRRLKAMKMAKATQAKEEPAPASADSAKKKV